MRWAELLMLRAELRRLWPLGMALVVGPLLQMLRRQ